MARDTSYHSPGSCKRLQGSIYLSIIANVSKIWICPCMQPLLIPNMHDVSIQPYRMEVLYHKIVDPQMAKVLLQHKSTTVYESLDSGRRCRELK